MKKKNSLKRVPVKLDLDKIEIDSLTNSMLAGIQGGYLTQLTYYPCGGCTKTQPPCITDACNPTLPTCYVC